MSAGSDATSATRRRAAVRRRPAAARRGRAEASDAAPAVVSAPERYIARVDTRTGAEVPGPIDPDELLVHAHRDLHPVEVAAQFVAGRLVALTGREGAVETAIRAANRMGAIAAKAVAVAVGSAEVERQAKRLLGVVPRDVYYRFREPTPLSDEEVRARVEGLQRDAAKALRARGRNPRLRVLVTGATGFVGKELLWQAASDRRIEEVVAVLRPETLRHPKTREVLATLSPEERGAALLARLGITGPRARKFRFVGGDIEQPGFGIDPAEAARLRASLTHVVHCAASVSFDDPYERSFAANVLGSSNALRFSLAVQREPGSAFVHHVAIETSYIHGRKRRSIAQENELRFPRHFYNNFYELTKAMASIETDRYLVHEGLRVAQLLPSIVIGDSRTGNNRGDTKVVNAPINAFGRAREALDQQAHDPASKVKAWVIAKVATGFPGDEAAELNLVPVDRVVAGILAALTAPKAIGNRIHLATDNRIRSADMVRICREELGVNVRLADPTLYRNVTLPLVTAALVRLGEPKLAQALGKLGTIFGGYGEWGQPVHDVGNDVRILGLPIRRPDTAHAFRMLCRHNRFVQQFGRVRDADEIARRERVWAEAVTRIEKRTGHEAGAIKPPEFRRLIGEEIELVAFAPRPRKPARRHREGGQ
jgi:nucleoside-diphosphate-sugar epimerase